MKIALILGTRPEIIKLSPIIRILMRQTVIEWYIIHTDQHYSPNMDRVFFEELELPDAQYHLGIGSGTHGDMTGRMCIEIEKILLANTPDVVIVQGDTNTVLAGALVASKIPGVRIAHVEAGLRSGDRAMPEETNRIITDHISDFCFAPTDRQADILRSEGIDESHIYTTGNTIVDAVYDARALAQSRSDTILDRYGLAPDGYILLTMHRPSNVDNVDTLRSCLTAVHDIAVSAGKKILFPVHPRTRGRIEKYGLADLVKNFMMIEPVGYVDTIALESHAHVIATDSGGIQEEACILERRTLILRDTTERPETLSVGGAILVGSDHDVILSGYRELCSRDIAWYNPFGDGTASERILSILSGK